MKTRKKRSARANTEEGKYVIEKNIPIPARRSMYREPTELMQKVLEMKVGDSLRIPELKKTQQTASLYKSAKKLGFKGKCAARTLPDGQGVRIWRIK